MHEEEQHIDIREKLLNLQKVKAGDDFMNTLQRKINLAEAEMNQKKAPEPEKVSVWVKLFGKNRNPWMIPSFSLTIVAILVLTVYILNTNKISDIPLITDYQKKETTNGLAPDEKKKESGTIEQTESKDIAGDLKKESMKNSEDLTGKTSTKLGDQQLPSVVNPSPTVTPKMDMKIDELSKPSSSDPIKTESGRVERKGDDRIYQENGKTVESSTIIEKEKKMEEAEQKISDDKSGNIDAVNSKGVIEKKDKKESKAMPKSKKQPVDSTKIDKKVLEKIKEEINQQK